jgi:diguanylate cyclase (GGDEF)-like protein
MLEASQFYAMLFSFIQIVFQFNRYFFGVKIILVNYVDCKSGLIRYNKYIAQCVLVFSPGIGLFQMLVEAFMDQSRTIMMTKKFITEFYDFGNTSNIIAYMEDSAIGFGTQSRRYAVGKNATERLLYKELALISPCKIAKLRLREEKISEGSCTVMANVILRTVRESAALVMHRMLFMYHSAERGGFRLTGIHIMKDIHHDSTYRIISASMLNRRLEAKADSTRIMSVVASYADCAYVVYRMDTQHIITFYSDELWKMLEYDSSKGFETASLHSMYGLVYEKDQHRIQSELTRQLLHKDVYQMEYRMRNSNGRLIWVLECGRRILSEDGYAACHSIITNITPLKKTSENLIYRESYDELTGLYNKRAFYQKAQELISLHPEKTFEIMRMDIDRFKIINDLFGEETGDKLLKYLSRFFVHMDLPLSVFGRLHSDHFLLCYPAENNNRQRFITSLRALAESYVLDYSVVPCFGVYCVRDRRLSVSAMCDRAGLALSKAKRNGLMVCGEYDENMRQRIVNEQAIINDMSDALDNGEFVIYIQPKYEPSSEKITGGEALVRWMHPVRGCVSPADFIPVFEHNGFIFRLDQYVWEETCKLLRKWIDEGKPAMPISVNVSRVDLYNTNLVNILNNLVKKYDIPASLLELELTESAYVDNPQQLIEVTKKLQAFGFIILMDDFGSGYSSLNMLKDMPVDILKIDLKFLDSKDESGRGGNILNSVVRMAKWLKLPVIAEGVETRQQAEFLRTIGCNCVQGYYYSRPVPVKQYEELIAANYCISTDNGKKNWLDARDTEELLNPNAQFNLIFNSMNGGIGLYEYTADSLEVLRANDGYFEMFQEDRESFYLQERQVFDRIYEMDRKVFVEALQAANNTGKVTQCRLRRHCKDGSLRWLRVRVSVIASDAERQLLYLAMEDINELQEKTLEMQTLFDNLPCGFGICRLENDVLHMDFFSKWLYEVHEITPQEFMEMTEGNLGKLLQDAGLEAWLKEKIIASYEKNRPVQLEYSFITRSGNKKNVMALFNTVQTEMGGYTCYFSLRDS